MANTYLIDLGMNDSVADIVRKCNQNFRRITSDQSNNMKGSVRREQERSDAALSGAVDTINDTIDNAVSELDKAIKDKTEELDRMIEDLKKKLEDLEQSTDDKLGDLDDKIEGLPDVSKDLADYWKKIYPVGSLYLSFNSTSPQSLFGGTWAKLGAAFLRAANDTNTGGEDTVTLTEANLPSHSHSLNDDYNYVFGSKIANTGLNYISPQSSGDRLALTYPINTPFNWIIETTNTGSGTAHNNMPYYQNVHVWRRTA